ncbi:MAG: hypothetical protein IH961_10785, partial [Chloroflexi bacterium]|nr:hypothetical protein [Chloroflexota bacterium]
PEDVFDLSLLYAHAGPADYFTTEDLMIGDDTVDQRLGGPIQRRNHNNAKYLVQRSAREQENGMQRRALTELELELKRADV